MNGALFLENGNRIRHPSGVFNGIDKTGLLELIDLALKTSRLEGLMGLIF